MDRPWAENVTASGKDAPVEPNAVVSQILGIGSRLHRRLNGSIDEDNLQYVAVQLGWPAANHRGVVAAIAVAEDPRSDLRRVGSALAARLSSGFAGPALLPEPVAHAVALAPWPKAPEPSEKDRLRKTLGQVARHNRTSVMVAHTTSVAELSRAYRTMCDYLHLIPRIHGEVEVEVISEHEFEVYDALARLDPADAMRIIRRTLGPILEMKASKRNPLLAFLWARAECGPTLTDVADWIGLSRKGAAYRTARVLELTGLDPRKPRDWFRLELAMRLLRLHPTD